MMMKRTSRREIRVLSNKMKCLLTRNSRDEFEGAQHSERPQCVQVEGLL